MTSVHATPPVAGTPQQYPFAEWLNGNTWTLTRGRDFWGPPHHFALKLAASARARRLNVDLVFEPDGRHITVTASPRPPKPDAPADSG